MKCLTLISLIIIPTVLISQSDRFNGQFRGIPCDDTVYRSEGLPSWKNYGQWLSECDSLEDAYSDSTFAIELDRRAKIKAEKEAQRQQEIDNIEDLDLEAMWENTVWEEIVDIAEDEAYEVEYITAVAGVRGAEAEDEALEHLYYRKSMKGLSKLDLQKALGKLIIKRDKLDKNHLDIPKLNSYITELRRRIKDV